MSKSTKKNKVDLIFGDTYSFKGFKGILHRVRVNIDFFDGTNFNVAKIVLVKNKKCIDIQEAKLFRSRIVLTEKKINNLKIE